MNFIFLLFFASAKNYLNSIGFVNFIFYNVAINNFKYCFILFYL